MNIGHFKLAKIAQPGHTGAWQRDSCVFWDFFILANLSRLCSFFSNNLQNKNFGAGFIVFQLPS